MKDSTKRQLAGLSFAVVMTLAVLLLISVGFGGLMDSLRSVTSKDAGPSRWVVIGVVVAVFGALLFYRLRRSRRPKSGAARKGGFGA
jgi:type VI protein secretion system component VasK